MKNGIPLFLFLFTFLAYSEEKIITLQVVDVVPGKDSYYFELLKESLEFDNYKVDLSIKKNIPLTRVEEYLANGKITLHWYMATEKRKNSFPIYADIGLTNGLMGYRILFIPKGEQHFYSKIKNLDDFRELNKVGAFGAGWYDVEVWRQNHLRYYEKQGDYKYIFNMLGSKRRNVDYFSRGALEILMESPFYPQLDVEKTFVLIYDMDFKFFFSEGNEEIKGRVEEALMKAKEAGIMDQLLKKYFPEIYLPEGLNLENRTKIYLKTPK